LSSTTRIRVGAGDFPFLGTAAAGGAANSSCGP
jgi:hypothetical protein